MARSRHASIAIEAIAAIAVLAVVLALAARMSGSMARHRSTMETQRRILHAKTELMNFALALPYDRVTEAEIVEWAEQSVGFRWRVEVVEGPSDASSSMRSKRISIEVERSGRSLADKQRRPLIGWRFPTDVATKNKLAGDGE